MPIYEYSCAKCGKTIEILQKMSDKPLKTHAGCGGKLTKLISAAGFQFKGTGWYVTDYARKGQAGGDSRSDSGKASGSAAGSNSADSGDKTSEKTTPSTESTSSPAPSSGSGKNKKK